MSFTDWFDKLLEAGLHVYEIERGVTETTETPNAPAGDPPYDPRNAQTVYVPYGWDPTNTPDTGGTGTSTSPIDSKTIMIGAAFLVGIMLLKGI